MNTGTFQEVKRQVCGVKHAPLSSAEVKESVEQYLYNRLQLSFQSLLTKLLDEINDSGALG
jgi:23S rRNA maturation-related 3'-5' exoribonuclease YhaM